MEDLPEADVYVLGELHDSPVHHRNQALAVTALQPNAIVFEMLRPEQVQTVRPEHRGDPAKLAAALGWADSGWPDFTLYWPIFEAASDIPLVGAALPRDTVRAAVSRGAAEVFGPDAASFGLDRPLPVEQQETREAAQMSAHCDALPPEMLGGMVEAQRLRDAAFARAVLEAVETHGAPVVLITGNGHARTDWGVPYFVNRIAPDLRVFALGQLEARPDEAQPYDAVLVTDPTERDDPCAAFRS